MSGFNIVQVEDGFKTFLIWSDGSKQHFQEFPNLECVFEYIVVMFHESKKTEIEVSRANHNCREHPNDPLKCQVTHDRICSVDDIKMFIDQLIEIHVFQPLHCITVGNVFDNGYIKRDRKWIRRHINSIF